MAEGFRLPLQTGASALRHLFAGSLAFVPGYLLLLGVVAASVVWPPVFAIGVYLGMAAVVLIGFGSRRLHQAFRDRPTDLLLNAQGARVEGGPHVSVYSMMMSWSDLARDNWHVGKDKDCTELVTGSGDTAMVLAHATEWGEAFSLQEIAELVAATAKERTGGPQDSGVVRFRCPTCGAPLDPADVDAVTCPYCEHAVPVPAELRQRTRAARQLQASERVTPELVRRFMAQPSARRVNAIGGIAALAMLGSWPGAAAAGAWLYYLDRLNVGVVAGLIILAPASIWLMYALASATITNRRALQLVALRLSAHSGSGGRPQCRVCGAGLDAGDDPVVTCRFCGTPNILGLDLRRAAHDALADEDELRFTLRQNADRRKMALVNVAFALGCTLLGAGVVFVGCL